jgi:hypothetical protein
VEVELFINPVQQVRKEFAEPDDSSTTVMFAQGRVLYDPTGIMQTLASEAKEILSKPRPVPSGQDLLRLRYDLTDMLKDAQDLAETDEEAANYQVFFALRGTLSAYYRLQGRRFPKPKHLMRDLQGHSPEIELLVRAVAASGISAEERCACLGRLVERVLEPAGGLLTVWQTEPEAVPRPEAPQ